MIDIQRIIDIESGGNASAFNKTEGAIGLCQIRSCVVKDWNMRHPDKQYTLNDMYDSQKNIEVATWYLEVRIPAMLRYYNIKHSSIEEFELQMILCYNWGIGNVVKWHQAGAHFENIPNSTKRYWKKYATNKSK